MEKMQFILFFRLRRVQIRMRRESERNSISLLILRELSVLSGE